MKITTRKLLQIFTTLTICFIAISAFGCVGLGTINVDAEVDIPEMGGPRPFAKRTLYLLRNSITSPEMEEAFKKYMASTTPPVNPGIPLKETDIRTRAGFMISEGRLIWHEYIVESVLTDMKGKATFKKLESGDYWIYCIEQTPSGRWLIWNVKATVNFYDTTNVKLSNENITFN